MQQFKKILTGLNDFNITIEALKQIMMHKWLTQCYFDFISEMIIDFVPKRIYHKMVKLVLDDFENELDEKVFTPYVINFPHFYLPPSL